MSNDTALFELQGMNEVNVLAYLAALQAYEYNAYVKHRVFWAPRTPKGQDVPELCLYLYLMRNPALAKFDFLFTKALSKLVGIYDTYEDAKQSMILDNRELTMYANLNAAVAESIALPSNKHLSQALGIIIGAESSSLPMVDKFIPSEYEAYPNTVLVKGIDTFGELMRHGKCALALNEAMPLRERMIEAIRCSAYAGVQSFESYFMAALKKPVFELVDGRPRKLSKWSSPHYVQSTSFATASIERGLKVLCANLNSIKEKSIPMVPGISSASNVANSLLP